MMLKINFKNKKYYFIHIFKKHTLKKISIISKLLILQVTLLINFLMLHFISNSLLHLKTNKQ
jgi:hypothetical protein